MLAAACTTQRPPRAVPSLLCFCAQVPPAWRITSSGPMSSNILFLLHTMLHYLVSS